MTNPTPTFRMTKYFQSWLKWQYKQLEPACTYFAWLKQIRESKQLPEYYARYQASKKPAKPEKPNANRATHLGTCQCCLRVQMLPNGLLSKHGYHVTHRGYGGFFAGVCRGTDQLPFELSCQAMKRFIQEATEQNAQLSQTIEQVVENAVKFPTQGWYREKVPCGSRGTIERWIYIQFEDGIQANTGKPFPDYVNSHTTKATEQAHKGNSAYINHLKSEQKHLIQFINDRLEKVANWTIKPLIERKENQ